MYAVRLLRPLQGRGWFVRLVPVAATAFGGLATGYCRAGLQPAMVVDGNGTFTFHHPATAGGTSGTFTFHHPATAVDGSGTSAFYQPAMVGGSSGTSAFYQPAMAMV